MRMIPSARTSSTLDEREIDCLNMAEYLCTEPEKYYSRTDHHYNFYARMKLNCPEKVRQSFKVKIIQAAERACCL